MCLLHGQSSKSHFIVLVGVVGGGDNRLKITLRNGLLRVYTDCEHSVFVEVSENGAVFRM